VHILWSSGDFTIHLCCPPGSGLLSSRPKSIIFLGPLSPIKVACLWRWRSARALNLLVERARPPQFPAILRHILERWQLTYAINSLRLAEDGDKCNLLCLAKGRRVLLPSTMGKFRVCPRMGLLVLIHNFWLTKFCGRKYVTTHNMHNLHLTGSMVFISLIFILSGLFKSNSKQFCLYLLNV